MKGSARDPADPGGNARHRRPGQPRRLAGPGTTAPTSLLIMADDLGYTDLGSYGSEIATPTSTPWPTPGSR